MSIIATNIGIGAWLGIIGAALAIAGVLGVAFAVLRSNVSLKTTELWKQQAEAMEERYNTEKEMHISCKEELAEVYERLAKVEKTQEILVGVVSSGLNKDAIALLHELGIDRRSPTRRARRDRTE